MAEVHVTVKIDGTMVSRIFAPTDTVQLADSSVITATELVAGLFPKPLATGETAVSGHEITDV